MEKGAINHEQGGIRRDLNGFLFEAKKKPLHEEGSRPRKKSGGSEERSPQKKGPDAV